MKWLVYALAIVQAGCGTTEPEPQMVPVRVEGTLTLDGSPLASATLRLTYQGCEFGQRECGYGNLYVVDETRSGPDGTYEIGGRVPQNYCGWYEGSIGIGWFPLALSIYEPLKLVNDTYKWGERRLDRCGDIVLDIDLSQPVNPSSLVSRP